MSHAKIAASLRSTRSSAIQTPWKIPLSLGGIYKGNNVHFGLEADICAAKSHVRFSSDSDRESGLPQTVMSALPPQSGHVRCNQGYPLLGHKRTLRIYSITSSARASTNCGIVSPMAFAVFKFSANRYCVGSS